MTITEQRRARRGLEPLLSSQAQLDEEIAGYEDARHETVSQSP